jgi:hypothetical protein
LFGPKTSVLHEMCLTQTSTYSKHHLSRQYDSYDDFQVTMGLGDIDCNKHNLLHSYDSMICGTRPRSRVGRCSTSCHPPLVHLNLDMRSSILGMIRSDQITGPPDYISWTSNMRCSVTRVEDTSQTFSTVPRMLRTRTQMGDLDFEVGC